MANNGIANTDSFFWRGGGIQDLRKTVACKNASLFINEDSNKDWLKVINSELD